MFRLGFAAILRASASGPTFAAPSRDPERLNVSDPIGRLFLFWMSERVNIQGLSYVNFRFLKLARVLFSHANG
jgi:hypothetical protein